MLTEMLDEGIEMKKPYNFKSGCSGLLLTKVIGNGEKNEDLRLMTKEKEVSEYNIEKEMSRSIETTLHLPSTLNTTFYSTSLKLKNTQVHKHIISFSQPASILQTKLNI
jgi:hypothetical protein